jgi:hypothetical protein
VDTRNVTCTYMGRPCLPTRTPFREFIVFPFHAVTMLKAKSTKDMRTRLFHFP